MITEKPRCKWCIGNGLYKNYHDEEWGIAVHDDAVFFEFLVLETFQAGLSWITILRKRENFRKAFDNFNCLRIAEYGDDKIEELMNDAGIIRNRLKVLSAISNAKAFMEIQKEVGNFDKYIWGFVNNKQVVNFPACDSENIATSPLSDAVSKDMKKRGFKFVGSTVIYAFLQATGIIDDHADYCWKKKSI